MPSSALTSPEGIRTDRPLHFSVKNIVPSSRKAMSHGFSSPSSTTSCSRLEVLVLAAESVGRSIAPTASGRARATGRVRRVCIGYLLIAKTDGGGLVGAGRAGTAPRVGQATPGERSVTTVRPCRHGRVRPAAIASPARRTVGREGSGGSRPGARAVPYPSSEAT